MSTIIFKMRHWPHIRLRELPIYKTVSRLPVSASSSTGTTTLAVSRRAPKIQRTATEPSRCICPRIRGEIQDRIWKMYRSALLLASCVMACGVLAQTTNNSPSECAGSRSWQGVVSARLYVHRRIARPPHVHCTSRRDCVDLRRPSRKGRNQRRRHAFERQYSIRASIRRERDYP